MDRLAAAELRRRCDPAKLPFRSTEELGDCDCLIGQDRALDAIRLSSSISHRDFNLFVSGPTGTGRHTAVKKLLSEKASKRPTPSDWVYVNNFDAVDRPSSIVAARLLRSER